MSEEKLLYTNMSKEIEEELNQDVEFKELQDLLIIAKGQDLTNYINTALNRIFEIQESKFKIAKERYFMKGYNLGKNTSEKS